MLTPVEHNYLISICRKYEHLQCRSSLADDDSESLPEVSKTLARNSNASSLENLMTPKERLAAKGGGRIGSTLRA